MTRLARWLADEMEARGLSQQAAADRAGVSIATINDILRQGHLPKMETLFRLADRFEVPREQVLRLAAGLPAEPGDEGLELDGSPGEEALVRELVEAFRAVPDEWKREAIEQVAMLARLGSRPPVRMVGEAADYSRDESR